MDIERIKALRDVKAQITSMNREVAALKSQQSEIESELTTALQAEGKNYYPTEYGTLELKEGQKVSLDSYQDFEEYVYENHALYLMQRRLSEAACLEEMERSEVPGLVVSPTTKLSFTGARYPDLETDQSTAA